MKGAPMMRKKAFEELVSSIMDNDLDISERSIPFKGGVVKLFYICQLTDRAALTEDVVKPLVVYCAYAKMHLHAQSTVDEIIYADSCKVESDQDRVLEFILSGMTVMLFSTDSNYVVINLKKVAKRAIDSPQLTYTLRGPQDSFTESLESNLSLVRYRVKDPNLCIKHFVVGERTKAAVAVIYIKDIANDIAVGEVEKRIRDIHVDGIGESGELQSYMLNNGRSLFPQMGLIERSDMAYHSLLEGKVLVLVDGSGVAIYAPKVFSEFFYSCDDRYDNKFYGAFNRFLRYVSIAIGLTASSIYVAITSFHTEVLPSDYAISLAQMRVNVPFSALVGTLTLEFIMELLREALLRVPKQIGPAVGIVGAIVIGQAAIAAGFFSAVLLTIAAVSLLASFAIPDYTLVSPFRILKFVLILFTGSLGFFGFTLCLTAIISGLVSINSFGVPYMAPIAPFNARDMHSALINRSDTSTHRPAYLNLKDRIRMRMRSSQKKKEDS